MGRSPPELHATGALHFLDRVVYLQAYTQGFRESLLLCGAAFMLTLVPALIMGRTRRP